MDKIELNFALKENFTALIFLNYEKFYYVKFCKLLEILKN